MSDASPPGFIFEANRLCLDFLNTRIIREGEPVDLLGSFEDLTHWLYGAGALTQEAMVEAHTRWSGTSEAERTISTASELRAEIESVIATFRGGGELRPSEVTTINRIGSRRTAIPYLAPDSRGVTVRHRREIRDGLDLLAPVADSLFDLISDDDPEAIGYCDSEECVLVYYDTSKNRSRRWCSMQRCGNRAKASAHYDRRRRPARG